MTASRPTKDGEHQQPVAECWRPALRSIVSAIRSGDFRLATSAGEVGRLPEDRAASLQRSLETYGEFTLSELPEETWDTSVAIWAGDRWDAQVDLWTLEEGRSDLVLHTEIRETETGFAYDVYGVYVP